MDPINFLRPVGAPVGRLKQVREARDMEKAVHERAQRMGSHVPPYKFLELIGKGSFGRVFKSQRHGKKDLVAVKIVDIDGTDYSLKPGEKDQAIKDFVQEISILQALKDSRAKNINTIHDSFTFHSQLWIVSEYCPGGSVHTLMKASPKPGLEEKYIIAISRELALALKFVHEAGVIHRDVKAANVLITEDGQLQLCDFGVSGVLENSAGKRSTIIGTPFWMAPELHSGDPKHLSYGTEIDCWAFGCTIYELATGQPPNARINPHMLHVFLRKAPRLEGDGHSAALRDFVSFSLEERPELRPKATDILKHPFILNTSRSYPTPMLRELLQRYAQWEQSGGQRASLFNPYGAAGPTSLDPRSNDEDDWNFSTTDEFNQTMLDQFPPQIDGRSRTSNEVVGTSRKQSLVSSKGSTASDKTTDEQRIMRGGQQIGRIFDQSAQPYEYVQAPEDEESHDLPLRTNTNADQPGNRETMIDLDLAHSLDVPKLDHVDVPTIKAQRLNRFYQDDDEEDNVPRPQTDLTRRLTKDWKFSTALTMPAQENARPKTQDWSMAEALREAELDNQAADEILRNAPTGASIAPPFRPSLKHTVTEPVGSVGDFLHPATVNAYSSSPDAPDRASFIAMDSDDISRPQTAASSTGESVMTDFTTGDPFDLEGNSNTIRPAQRTSFHIHSQSEPTPVDRSSGDQSYLTQHYRGESTFSSDSEWERNRPISVQASVDELRQVVAAEEYWDKDFLPPFQARFVPAQKPPPLLMAPRGPTHEGGNWSRFDPEVTSLPIIDLDMALIPQASTEINGLGLHGAKDVGPRFRHHSRGRNSGLDQGPNRIAANGPKLQPPVEFGAKRVMSFPRLTGPDAAALEEDANAEVMVAEVERLLDDFLAGLRVAEGLVRGDGGAQ